MTTIDNASDNELLQIEQRIAEARQRELDQERSTPTQHIDAKPRQRARASGPYSAVAHLIANTTGVDYEVAARVLIETKGNDEAAEQWIAARVTDGRPMFPVEALPEQRDAAERARLDARPEQEAERAFEERRAEYETAREQVARCEAALSSARKVMIEAADALRVEIDSRDRRETARLAPQIQRKARELAPAVMQATGCGEDDARELLRVFGCSTRGIYLAVNWAHMQIREGRPIRPIDQNYGRGT